jgi:hypothetical protein
LCKYAKTKLKAKSPKVKASAGSIKLFNQQEVPGVDPDQVRSAGSHEQVG